MSTRDKAKNSQKRYSPLSNEEVGTLSFSDATLRLVTATLTPPLEGAMLRKDETLMAKLLGPDFISLQVSNLSASRTFYIEKLGFTIDERFNAPDFVLFDTNTIPFALSQAKAELNVTPGSGVVLWIDCDHVNELHAALEGAGTTIITPPYDGPFGRTFVFADPDGYRITANENPWERFPLGGRHQG